MVWSMEILTKNAQETKEFGKKFANRLIGGEIIALSGDLGSGKTTFVQGLAEGLGVRGRILSPTFVLMREHWVKIRSARKARFLRNPKHEMLASRDFCEIRNFYHVDLYRLEGNVERELKSLGIEEIWGKRKNVVAIEWAEKAKNVLPKDAIWIRLESIGPDEGRKIKVD